MYLILMQQKFNTNSEVGGPRNILIYGKPIYLSEDMTYFVYDGVQYGIKFKYMKESVGTQNSIARFGMRGPVNVYLKKYYYQTNNDKWFIIVQTKDVNIYLHNKFELNHVIFDNMQFEMVIDNNELVI